MYNSLHTIPFIPLPTLRIASLLTFISFFALRTQLRPGAMLLFLTGNAFVLYTFLQCIIIDSSAYNIASATGLALLIYSFIFILSHAGESTYYIINAITFSGVILVGSQLFQIAAFSFGRHDLLFVFNDDSIIASSNSLRIVGGLFGPSGLMAESGHVALFLGPLVMNLILLNHYSVKRTHWFILLLFFCSIALTLSGGAFIQLSFCSLLILLVQKSNLKRFVWLIVIITTTILFFFLLKDYVDLLLFKALHYNPNDDLRRIGARSFWSAFHTQPLLGHGPEYIKQIDADPNMLLPLFLASYGLFGAFFFSIFIVVSPVLIWMKGHAKLFIIPLGATFIHLSIAYGTISWAFLWANLAISIFGFRCIPVSKRSEIKEYVNAA